MAWGQREPRGAEQRARATRNQADTRQRIRDAGLTRETEEKAGKVVQNRKNNAGNN